MQCNDCLSVVLNDDANMLISKYLRLVAGLLQPMDIGFIRFVRGLTVEEMAEKLGITEQKMMRIENGLQIQDRSTDTLLRGLL
jgi:DNA-directed RNA polymerase specialized sigma subunit